MIFRVIMQCTTASKSTTSFNSATRFIVPIKGIPLVVRATTSNVQFFFSSSNRQFVMGKCSQMVYGVYYTRVLKVNQIIEFSNRLVGAKRVAHKSNMKILLEVFLNNGRTFELTQ